MVLIKVQYDAYNRQFKLVDRESVKALEDGEIYMVLSDVTVEDVKLARSSDIPAEVEQSVCA